MIKNRPRVGLHGRNDYRFRERDYELVRVARIETLKMLSLTLPDVFKRLREENPDIEFIVRLYDGRIGPGRRVTPKEFCDEMIPKISAFQPYTKSFEVHNEPNHPNEGWGDWGDRERERAAQAAREFCEWFNEVYDSLKGRFPWADFGFPALVFFPAAPWVRCGDVWLEICRPSIERADWLAVHCYWQTTPEQPINHLKEDWGLSFKYWHKEFPDKTLEITEAGNSNGQNGIPLEPDEMARQLVEWYQEVFKYPYIGSACPFLMSSPDPRWERELFVWCKADGTFLPTVQAVGNMNRPPLFVEEVEEPIPEEIGYTLKPKINDKSHALPLHPTKRYQTRNLERIKYIVIHHSAVSPDVTPERIAKYHIENLDWPGIGYHFYICPDGAIYQTNELETISYHVGAKIEGVPVNDISVGICLAGSFTGEARPQKAQLISSASLCAYLLRELSLPIEAIKGHKEFMATRCPGDRWEEEGGWKKELLEEIEYLASFVKPIRHYVLFWQLPEDWAKEDWIGATKYIGRFRPTCGFSVDDAKNSEFVTIVGGPLGVSPEVERMLIEAGCKVERIGGRDEAETKRILDEMAEKGQRFLNPDYLEAWRGKIKQAHRNLRKGKEPEQAKISRAQLSL